jgi:hypothetical protein
MLAVAGGARKLEVGRKAARHFLAGVCMKSFGLIALLAPSLFLIALPAAVLAAPACREPKDAPILSPPMAARVIGKGRLQFYSAPEARCPIPGVFVIPKDEVVAYVQTDDGWTSVMYFGNGGSDASGWVRSNLLKFTGTVGPSYQ